jgi:hypothetical protein
MIRYTVWAIAALPVVMAAGNVQATDPSTERFGAGDTQFGMSIDQLQLTGRKSGFYEFQLAFFDSDKTWKTSSTGVTLSARHGLTQTITLLGSVTTALSDASSMTNRLHRAVFFDDLQVTDWSYHGDTELDDHIAIDAMARLTLHDGPLAMFGAIAGVSYSRTKWSAYGGEFYTLNDPQPALFPEDGIAYDYLLSLPTAYAGVTGSWSKGSWAFEGSLKIGQTFNASDVENERATNGFTGRRYGPGLYLGLGAETTFQWRRGLKLSFGAQVDHHDLVARQLTLGLMGGPPQSISNFDGAFRIPRTTFTAIKLSAGLKAEF